MKLSAAAAALVPALPVAYAGLTSSAAARRPVTCVAFHPDETTNSLQMNECLAAGNAICSSNGKWAFGIDAADQRIKLWEDDRVSYMHADCDRCFEFLSEIFRLVPSFLRRYGRV